MTISGYASDHTRPRLGHIAKRWLYLVHRWIGIAVCVLFLFWFISGIVMMYVPYPALTAQERLAGLKPIDWAKVKLTPTEALEKALYDGFPNELRLEMQGDEPLYRIRADSIRLAISAVDGRTIGPVDARMAAAIATEFTKGGTVDHVEAIDRDQWTVAQGFNWARPLHKVVMADDVGRELYVASANGEVAQDTTRTERFWNWLGSVPHWLYLTVIRKDGQFWRQVVMWTSGPAAIAGITGLWVGILRMRMRRYKSGSISPYRSGWMKWHHIIGLFGGLTAITWMASGWLSVGPFGYVEGGHPPDLTLAYAAHDTADFPALDGAGLTSALPGAKIARMNWVAGRPQVTLLRDGPLGLSVTPVGAKVQWREAALLDNARKAYPGHAIVGTEQVREPDLYWYSRAPNPFRPALRVRFADAGQTWVHLDPVSGDLLEVQDKSARTYRWLFTAVHDFDLPLLLAHRVVRDPLMWVLSALGIVTSLSGIVIGWRRLKIKFRPRPARAAH